MPGIERNTPLSLSLIEIKETGFSIRPDLRESDIKQVGWMIGFRPILGKEENHISVEVRADAVNKDNNIEVASCSLLVTYYVENLGAFVTKVSDNRLNIRDQLMLNMLNSALGTLRGVMHVRFSGSLLENKPLPLIDVQEFVKVAKKNPRTI